MQLISKLEESQILPLNLKKYKLKMEKIKKMKIRKMIHDF
jgi:hypothetical protein